MNSFAQFVFNAPARLALPIAVYPGVALTGATVRDVVTDARAQRDASAAIHQRFQTLVALTAMDLSVEAEAFGADIAMSDHEIPTVTGRWVTSLAQARSVAVPQPGDKRTAVYLESVRLLRHLPGQPLVLGGCIGPFSLAARLAGVSEALELTLSEPELMHTLVEKTTQFLIAYMQAFRTAGAAGVIMAEPGAGLLSPRGMSEFSSAYIKHLVGAVTDTDFTVILHNCAARFLHLSAVLEAGAQVYHFGAPMDIVAALGKVNSDIVLCGNLDPTAVFCHAGRSEIAEKTGELLRATRSHRNFVISSGCDIPASAPITNIEAFFEAAAAGGPAAH